jgi:predicted Co/Zn/Cd cation transporter (cation efflux family)
MCQGEGLSDEKMKHNRVFETDCDTGGDDTQVQRKQNHAVLSCYVTRIAETTQPFVEIFWLQPNEVKRRRVLILSATRDAVKVALRTSTVTINSLITRKR